VAVFTDGAYALPTGAIAGLNSRPAKPGDILTLYGVGFGPVTPNIPAGQLVQQLNMLTLPLQLSIGGLPASLLYDGLAPDFTGLYQFNVTMLPGMDSNYNSPPKPAPTGVPFSTIVRLMRGSFTLYRGRRR
jgi:uncharacterized protein (TIGR03437 family)